MGYELTQVYEKAHDSDGRVYLCVSIGGRDCNGNSRARLATPVNTNGEHRLEYLDVVGGPGGNGHCGKFYSVRKLRAIWGDAGFELIEQEVNSRIYGRVRPRSARRFDDDLPNGPADSEDMSLDPARYFDWWERELEIRN